jgi:hypothetical protein
MMFYINDVLHMMFYMLFYMMFYSAKSGASAVALHFYHPCPNEKYIFPRGDHVTDAWCGASVAKRWQFISIIQIITFGANTNIHTHARGGHLLEGF